MLEVVAAAALLDLVVYWQHRLFDLTPVFWRMHRMHHADLDFDATTALRLLVATPDMHWVHHSIEGQEYNSNFSFNLPWWDRLFGSYREQPAPGHIHMRIGLHAYSGQICADLI